MIRALVCLVALLSLGAAQLRAEDWPEYRGKGRKGEWNETGILETFPAEGLKALWRTPVKGGYSGPAVAGGRIFVTDFTVVKGLKGVERAMALDEKTGRVLWTREWDANYAGLMWAHGPRATPTVDGDRVYVLGAMGVLHCLDVSSGTVLWKTDYVKDYGAPVSMWGIAAAPLVDGHLLIAIVNGEPDALVVAFDKRTGTEVWRALPSMAEPGVNHPIIVTGGGRRQLVFWSPDAIHSLDPATGKVFWRQPWKVGDAMNLALPVQSGSRLLISHFSHGSMLLSLDDRKPQVTEIWRGKSTSEIVTDGLHSMYGTPIIDGDYIYGLCSYGQLRCLRLSTGERVWETQAAIRERTRWASGNLVRNGDRVFISNDRGELIIARMTPTGYQEIDRTNLITPTTPPGVRRQLGAVLIAHPAFANRNVYARNDEELIAYSMAAIGAPIAAGSLSRASAVPRKATPEKATPDRVVHIQYMPALADQKRIADPNNTAYSTLYLLTGGGAHSIAFATDNGVVLVNTKQPGWGPAMKETLALATNEPVTTIINTQPDTEYTGNNSAFPTAVSIVAHGNTKRMMAPMAAFAGANARFLPNRTFADTMSLFDGRNRIDLYHFGRGHTDGDTVVVFPAFGLAYLGELFPGKTAPTIDRSHGGSAVAFPETLAKAIAALKGVEIIVPGRVAPSNRGNLLKGLPSLKDLQEYADFNRDFLAVVRQAVQAGKSPDEAAATLKMPQRYAGYDMAHAKANVRAIFDELKK